MSATRSQWARMIDQVMQLVYEQDDNYMGRSYEQSEDEINQHISQWRVIDLETYIRENFKTNDSDMLAVCNSARTTCACQL